VVAATMLVCTSIINTRQQQVMLDQMIEHGASLTKLIATESAVAALNEDWVSIDVAVQDVATSLQLERLVVADVRKSVRVSTDSSAIGRTYDRAPGITLASRDPIVSVQRAHAERGAILDFQAPIRFQDRQVGTIRIGLLEAPLSKLAYQSWLLMLLLMLVTVASAVLAMYYIAAHYSKPIRLLKESMDEIGAGRLAFRIKEKRDDELGVLYRTFDRMADQLEQGWHRQFTLQSNQSAAPVPGAAQVAPQPVGLGEKSTPPGVPAEPPAAAQP
jgi:eukaryotic-like serine/threonine-protein kinase